MTSFNAARLAVLAGALAASLPACNGPFANGDHRVVGVIDPAGSPQDPLVLPDAARAGIPFTITVSTFGSSCLRSDGATAQVSGTRASVTPFDLVPDLPCTADIGAHPRAVRLVFRTPGTATIQVHGRGYSSPTITVQKTLVVAP